MQFNRLIFVSFLLLTRCGDGCIVNDDSESWQAANPVTLYPINLNVVAISSRPSDDDTGVGVLKEGAYDGAGETASKVTKLESCDLSLDAACGLWEAPTIYKAINPATGSGFGDILGDIFGKKNPTGYSSSSMDLNLKAGDNIRMTIGYNSGVVLSGVSASSTIRTNPIDNEDAGPNVYQAGGFTKSAGRQQLKFVSYRDDSLEQKGGMIAPKYAQFTAKAGSVLNVSLSEASYLRSSGSILLTGGVNSSQSQIIADAKSGKLGSQQENWPMVISIGGGYNNSAYIPLKYGNGVVMQVIPRVNGYESIPSARYSTPDNWQCNVGPTGSYMTSTGKNLLFTRVNFATIAGCNSSYYWFSGYDFYSNAKDTSAGVVKLSGSVAKNPYPFSNDTYSSLDGIFADDANFASSEDSAKNGLDIYFHKMNFGELDNSSDKLVDATMRNYASSDNKNSVFISFSSDDQGPVSLIRTRYGPFSGFQDSDSDTVFPYIGRRSNMRNCGQINGYCYTIVPFPWLMPRWEIDKNQTYSSKNFTFDVFPVKASSGYLAPYFAYQFGYIDESNKPITCSGPNGYDCSTYGNIPIPFKTQVNDIFDTVEHGGVKGLTIAAQNHILEKDFVRCTSDWRNPGWVKLKDMSDDGKYYFDRSAISSFTNFYNVYKSTAANQTGDDYEKYKYLKDEMDKTVNGTSCSNDSCLAKFPTFKEGDYPLSGTIYSEGLDNTLLDGKFKFNLVHSKFGGLVKTPVIRYTPERSVTYYTPKFKPYYPKQLIYIKNVLSDPLNARNSCTFSVNNATQDSYEMDMSFPLTEKKRNLILHNKDNEYDGGSCDNCNDFDQGGPDPWRFFASTRLLRGAFTAGIIAPKWHKLTKTPITKSEQDIIITTKGQFLSQNGIGFDVNNVLDPYNASVDSGLCFGDQTYFKHTSASPPDLTLGAANFCGKDFDLIQDGYPITKNNLPKAYATPAYYLNLSLDRVFNTGDYGKFPSQGGQTRVKNQYKDCGIGAAFRVVPLPTLSCIKGYKLRCINPRLNEYIDNAVANIATHDQQTYNMCQPTDQSTGSALGACYARITPQNSGVATDYVMRYYASQSQSANSLQLNQLMQIPYVPFDPVQQQAGFSGLLTNFSILDNLSSGHCGFCVPSSLVVKNGKTNYIPSSVALNLYNNGSVHLNNLAGLISGSYISNACTNTPIPGSSLPTCLIYTTKSQCESSKDAVWLTEFSVFQNNGLSVDQRFTLVNSFITTVNGLLNTVGGSFECIKGGLKTTCDTAIFPRQQDFLEAYTKDSSGNFKINQCLSFLDSGGNLTNPNCDPDNQRSCVPYTLNGQTITPKCNTSINPLTNVVAAVNVNSISGNLDTIFQFISTENTTACVNLLNSIYNSMYNFFATDYSSSYINIDVALDSKIRDALNKKSTEICQQLIAGNGANTINNVSMKFVQNDYTGMCADDKAGAVGPLIDTFDSDNEVNSLVSITKSNSSDPNTCSNPYFTYTNPCLPYTVNGVSVDPKCNPDTSAADRCAAYQIANLDGTHTNIQPQCNTSCASGVATGVLEERDVPYYRAIYGVNAQCDPDETPVADLTGAPITYTSYTLDQNTVYKSNPVNSSITVDPCSPYRINGVLINPQCNPNSTIDKCENYLDSSGNVVNPNCNPDPNANPCNSYRDADGLTVVPKCNPNGTNPCSSYIDAKGASVTPKCNPDITKNPCKSYLNSSGVVVDPKCNPGVTNPCAPYKNTQGTLITPRCNYSGLVSSNNKYDLNGVTVYAQDDVNRIASECDTCNSLNPQPSLYYQDVTVGQAPSSSVVVSTGVNGFTCSSPYIPETSQHEDPCYMYLDPWFAAMPSGSQTCQSYTSLSRNTPPTGAISVPNANLTAIYKHTDYVGLIGKDLLNVDPTRYTGKDPSGIPYLPTQVAFGSVSSPAIYTPASATLLPGNYLCCDPQNAYFCNSEGRSPAVTKLDSSGVLSILGYPDTSTAITTGGVLGGAYQSSKDCFVVSSAQMTADIGKQYNCRVIPDTSSFTPSDNLASGVDSTTLSAMLSLDFFSSGCGTIDYQNNCPSGQYEDGYYYVDEVSGLRQVSGASSCAADEVIVASSKTGGSSNNTTTGAFADIIAMPNSIYNGTIHTYINPTTYNGIVDGMTTVTCPGMSEVVNDPVYGTDESGNLVTLASTPTATPYKINDKLCSSDAAVSYFPNLVSRSYRGYVEDNIQYINNVLNKNKALNGFAYYKTLSSDNVPSGFCVNENKQTIGFFDKIYIPVNAHCGEGPYKEYYSENVNTQCQLYSNNICNNYKYVMCTKYLIGDLNQDCSDMSTSNLDISNVDEVYARNSSDLPTFGTLFSLDSSEYRYLYDINDVTDYSRSFEAKDLSSNFFNILTYKQNKATLGKDYYLYSYTFDNNDSIFNFTDAYKMQTKDCTNSAGCTLPNSPSSSSGSKYTGVIPSLFFSSSNNSFNLANKLYSYGYYNYDYNNSTYTETAESVYMGTITHRYYNQNYYYYFNNNLAYYKNNFFVTDNAHYNDQRYSTAHFGGNTYRYYYYRFYNNYTYYNQSPQYSRYRPVILYGDSAHVTLQADGKQNYTFDYYTTSNPTLTSLDFKHVKDVATTSIFSNNFGRTARKTLQNDDNNSEWVRDTTYFPCNNENPNDYGYNCYLLGTDLNTRSEFLNNITGSGYIKGLEPSGKVIPNASGSAYTTSLNFSNSDFATFYQDVLMVNGQNLFTPVEINDNNGRKILTIDTVTRLYYNNSSPVYFYSNYFWDHYYFYRNSFNSADHYQNVVNRTIYRAGIYTAFNETLRNIFTMKDSLGINILGGSSLYLSSSAITYDPTIYLGDGNIWGNYTQRTSNVNTKWSSGVDGATTTLVDNTARAGVVRQPFQVARDFKVCTRPAKTTIVTCGQPSSLRAISKGWFNQVAVSGGVPITGVINNDALTQPVTGFTPILDDFGNKIPFSCSAKVNGSCPLGTVEDSGMCRNFALCKAVSYNLTCGKINRKMKKICRNYKTCRRPYQEVRYCKKIGKLKMAQCKNCEKGRQVGELTGSVPDNLKNFYAYLKTNSATISLPNQVVDDAGNSVSYDNADLLFYLAPPVYSPNAVTRPDVEANSSFGCGKNYFDHYYKNTSFASQVTYLCGIENRFSQFKMESLDDVQKGVKLKFSNALSLNSGEPLYFYLQPFDQNGNPDPKYHPETFFKNWDHYRIANNVTPKVYKFTDYSNGTPTASFSVPAGGGKLWFIILDQYSANPSGQNKFGGQDGKRIDFYDNINEGLKTVNGQNYSSFNAGQYNISTAVQFGAQPNDAVLLSLSGKLNSFVYDIMVQPVKDILYGTWNSATNDYNWTEGLVYQASTFITGQILVQMLYYFAIIMYVFVYGLKIITGQQKIEIKEILADIVRFTIVNAFVSPATWSMYQEMIVKMLFKIAEGFIMLTTGAFTGSATMNDVYQNTAGLRDPGFGDVSTVLNFILQKNTLLRVVAIAFSSWTGWLVTILLMLSIGIFVINVYKAIFVYIGNLLVIAIYLVLGPLAIIALGHPATRDMFDKWWKGLLSSVAQQVAMFIGIGIFAGIYNNLLQNLLNFTICMEPVLQIPIINITLFSMWKVAGSLPSMFMAYMGNPPASGDPVSITIFDGLSVYFVVVMMDKFTNESIEYGAKLFGGSVNGFTDAIGKAFDAVKGQASVGNIVSGVAGIVKKK